MIKETKNIKIEVKKMLTDEEEQIREVIIASRKLEEYLRG